MKIPAFIIMFNRLTWPKKMAEYMSDTGCEVFLVDNGSTYPPLLEWYEKCPYKIYKLGTNFGHHVLWTCDIVENNHPNTKYYIATDPDLDLTYVPPDYIEVLRSEWEQHSDPIDKVGLSLEIDDLPRNNFTAQVLDWETPFWETKTDSGFYKADIDTTFAMYDHTKLKSNMSFYKGIRSPRPYTARHLPWYLTSLVGQPEELYYKDHINKDLKSVSSSYWSIK